MMGRIKMQVMPKLAKQCLERREEHHYTLWHRVLLLRLLGRNLSVKLLPH